MQNMIYTSKRGKEIVFDDYVDNTEEYDSYYAEMCPHCHNKYRGILGNRASSGAMGTCSVKRCENEAEYYVDFSKNEISISFFEECDCYSNFYSSTMIIGAAIEQVQDAAKRIYKDKVDFICNNGKLHKDGSITFDVYKEDPQLTAYNFSRILKDAVVYADTSWDEHTFYAYKDGYPYDDYSLRWENEEPESYEEYDEIYYDCSVVLKDNKSGCECYLGGGMCTEEEFETYRKLIEKK